MNDPTGASESFCANRLRVLGEPSRLAVMRRLLDGPQTVSELNDALALEQSLLSHHLRILRESGLVEAVRDGRHVRYHLSRGRGISLLRGWVGDRTVVVFDIRGTGETGPLMCPAASITESDIAAMDLAPGAANMLERGAYLACRDDLLSQGIDSFRATRYSGSPGRWPAPFA